MVGFIRRGSKVMIFVTLGSQRFQFNRLLQKLDELVSSKIIKEEIFAQIGYSDYIPKYFKYKKFLDREEYAQMEEKADMIITHGGTGAIMGAVKKRKKVIAVPRLERYGEHVDDHQIQILKQFDEMEIIEACYEIERLEEVFIKSQNTVYKSYKSNTEEIIASIDKFLQQ